MTDCEVDAALAWAEANHVASTSQPVKIIKNPDARYACEVSRVSAQHTHTQTRNKIQQIVQRWTGGPRKSHTVWFRIEWENDTKRHVDCDWLWLVVDPRLRNALPYSHAQFAVRGLWQANTAKTCSAHAVWKHGLVFCSARGGVCSKKILGGWTPASSNLCLWWRGSFLLKVCRGRWCSVQK